MCQPFEIAGLDELRVELERCSKSLNRITSSRIQTLVELRCVAAWLPQPEDKMVASADLTLRAGDNREGILHEREDSTTYAIWSPSSVSVSMSVFAIVITTVENFCNFFHNQATNCGGGNPQPLDRSLSYPRCGLPPWSVKPRFLDVNVQLHPQTLN